MKGSDANLAGYEVLWRETTSPDWTIVQAPPRLHLLGQRWSQVTGQPDCPNTVGWSQRAMAVTAWALRGLGVSSS